MRRFLFVLVLAVCGCSNAGTPIHTTSTPPSSTVAVSLQLRADGLRVVDFGTPMDETLEILSQMAGSSPSDEGEWAAWVEYVGWENLGLYVGFSQAAWSEYDGVRRFVGWAYSHGDGTLSLTTTTGVGLGTTVAGLRSIYGDLLTISEELDECLGWVLRLPGDEMVLILDGPPRDDAKVLSIVNGLAVGC